MNARARQSAPLLYAIAIVLLLAVLLLGPGRAQAQTPPAQPTQLAVTHRSGQTFITWREISGQPSATYRVYRHTAAINAGNLAQAQFLYEVPAGSSRFYANRYNVQSSGVYAPRYVDNLVISDDGSPLAEGTGLLVWTLEAAADFGGGTSGSRYYAVTTKLGGVENTTSFGAANATSSATAESVADPLPVELDVAGVDTGGHIFIQYMNLRRWNPTFHAPNAGNGYYGLDAADPTVANAIQYMYDYAIYEPSAADCGGTLPTSLPVYIRLDGWGDNAYPPTTGHPDPYGWCVYNIFPIDVNQTWYFGFAQNHDFRAGGEIASDDSVANFTEERILRMVYDLIRQPPGRPVDANRIFVYGHSMGGSGTLALALRYPNVFAAAYASEPMTNYATSGTGGGIDWRTDVDWKWGTVAQNLPVIIRAPGGWATGLSAYNGTGVYDWQNHQATISGRGATDEFTPLGIGHGRQDDVIEWTTQGRPVYAALNGARMVWGGVVEDVGHTWIGFDGLPPELNIDNSWQPFYGWRVRKNETMPGLSNNSRNLAIPPAAAGGYNLNVRWSSSWDPWNGAPTDTAGEWAMSFCYNAPGDPTCGSGSPLTVDVTVRRPQQFVVTPGAAYDWENRRVSDNALVASGSVSADANSRLTVAAFALSAAAGNKLIIRPADDDSVVVRPWPDTTDGIHVFNDQLDSGMTVAQRTFAANNYAGTQKMTRADADALRAINPDFLILHYRLGAGLGYRIIDGACSPTGSWISIIEGDWVREWPDAVDDDWFYKVSGSRVLNCDWGWYLTDPDSADWRAYWGAEVARQMAANDDDGLFMDSTSVPNYLGADRYVPSLPVVDSTFETAWSNKIDNFLSWLQTQPAGDYWIVPNVGSWVTTRDPTTYSAADGIMIEGFALWGDDSPFDRGDWELQMNRALGFTRLNKALIAQSYLTDARSRLFALGSYLLIKSSKSYINHEYDMAPEWWPEYDIDIGTPTQSAGADIDNLLTAAGVFRRNFSNGFVLVNANADGAAITVPLGGTYRLAQPVGGGLVPTNGSKPGSLTYSDVTQVMLAPYSAAILLNDDNEINLPIILVSSTSGGTVGGVRFADEDILRHDPNSGGWSLYFDGSDVGLATADIDAAARLDDGSLLLSLDAPIKLLGQTIDDSDILRFVPTSMGATTAGSFSLYFDGSDVGLTTAAEDIDAITTTPAGDLVLSTLGNVVVSGVSGQGRDLLRFRATTLGATTTGTFSLHFDGSDVGLNVANEDIGGADIHQADGSPAAVLYLSTVGPLSAGSVSAAAADVSVCDPVTFGATTGCTFGSVWRGVAAGFGGEVIDALDIE